MLSPPPRETGRRERGVARAGRHKTERERARGRPMQFTVEHVVRLVPDDGVDVASWIQEEPCS